MWTIVDHQSYILLDTRGPMCTMDGMTSGGATGLELRVRRVAADVRAKALAEAMGVDPSRIAHIEAARNVTQDTVARYLAALATCATKSTEVA